MVEGNERNGAISSDPAVNNLAVSKTRIGPWTIPTNSLVSPHANERMLGVAGAIDSVRLGGYTLSEVSRVASKNAARKSDNGENINAAKYNQSSEIFHKHLAHIYPKLHFELLRQTNPSRWLPQKAELYWAMGPGQWAPATI